MKKTATVLLAAALVATPLRADEEKITLIEGFCLGFVVGVILDVGIVVGIGCVQRHYSTNHPPVLPPILPPAVPTNTPPALTNRTAALNTAGMNFYPAPAPFESLFLAELEINNNETTEWQRLCRFAVWDTGTGVTAIVTATPEGVPTATNFGGRWQDLGLQLPTHSARYRLRGL